MNTSTKRRLRRVRELLLVALLVALVYACDAVTHYSGSGGTPAASTPGVIGGSGNGSSGTVVVSNPGGALPVQANKPQPPPNTFQGCPANGDGGDPELNLRKNRIDPACSVRIRHTVLANVRRTTFISV